MESIDENFSKSAFGITETSRQHLMETAKWAQFLAILGFVGLGLMIVGALFLMSVGSQVQSMGFRGNDDVPFGMIAFIYVVMAVLFFFPMFYLFKFAIKMKEALGSSSPITFDEATGFLKSHYKFNGIFAIIILSIYVLLILIAVLAAMTGM